MRLLVEIARLAEDEGVEAITVHPHTRSQQFGSRAAWAIIAEVVAAVAIPVTGNGDVRSHDDAAAMQRATGRAAVMIGRGALGAPWGFSASPTADDDPARIIRRHCALILGHLPERAARLQLKKHLAWYSSGRPGGARLRPTLFAASTADEVRGLFWDHWRERAAGAPQRTAVDCVTV